MNFTASNTNPRPDTPKAKVYLLYTGGTFGMEPDLETPGGPLRPMALSKLKRWLPAPETMLSDVEVTLERFDRLLDSSSMKPSDWSRIAARIEENYDCHDGFIILHGTDTLAYTASALSFMLENLAKPVIVTGSQVPLVEPETDARLNYQHALQLAAYQVTGLPLVPEVVVVFADKIIRGCRARKMRTGSPADFESPNSPPLGEIREQIQIFEDRIRPLPPANSKFQVKTNLNSDVLDFSLYPGLQAEHLRQILSLEPVKGVLLRTFGAGNAPEDQDFLTALDGAIQKNNKVVVNITQCPYGTVKMELYAASLGLRDCGVISGLDLTPEAALTKLMVLLGRERDEQVKSEMQIDQRGEQSWSLFHFAFPCPEALDRSHKETIETDSRFDPAALDRALLRITNLQTVREEGADKPHLDLFLNLPDAPTHEQAGERHPHHLFRVDLTCASSQGFVEKLPTEKIKALLECGKLELTFIPSKGVRVRYEDLTLSLFTKAG